VFAKAILFLGIGALAGRFAFRRFLALIDGTKFTLRFPEVPFIFATMLAFLYGMVAELMGLSAIVGAFIAGASLGGVQLRQGKDFHQGSEYLQIIFGSVFFVSLGILADVKALQTHVLLFLLVLVVVAFISKVVGCGTAALLTRSSIRDSMIA
jgi:Kef-type K+ transport system membrane component KefB